MKKAVAYCRVANKQDSEFALHFQELEIKEYCKQKGYELSSAYKDTGSGLNQDRAGLKAIVELIKEKQADAVIVTSFDRISRQQFEVLEFYKFIREHDFDFISTKEGPYSECYNESEKPLMLAIQEWISENSDHICLGDEAFDEELDGEV